MTDEMYTVERHNDAHYGPHASEYAETLDTALAIASEMREGHRGSSWYMNTEVGGKERLSFHPEDARGWVTVRKVQVHE